METDPTLEYFSDLANDLSSLRPAIGNYKVWNEYNAAVAVMGYTAKALSKRTAESSEYPKTPFATALGERVASMYLSGIQFTSRKKEGMPGCCSEAEWKLAHSISDLMVEDPKSHSPIILTIRGRAVAIGKQWAEPTWYGLVNIPERGFYAGVFSAIAHIPRAQEQPENDKAYSYELPPQYSPDNLRFSLFATPIEKRKHLRVVANLEAQIVTQLSHEDIVNRATTLLRTAIRIN